MRAKEKDVLLTIIAAALLFIVFDCLTGKAGSLEPYAAPQPTMVTLDQLSIQIAELSSPVKKVVKGIITFEDDVSSKTETFTPTVDPNRCIVLLSDAVSCELPTTDDNVWMSRTGTCLFSLTDSAITILTEPHPAVRNVSYQIIEYK